MPLLSDPGASQDGYSLMTNRGTGLTVKTLVAFAYGVRELQVSGGPGWISTDHYDVAARAGQPATVDYEIREMLRSLLAKRFGLVIRDEMRSPISWGVLLLTGPD
jgi:uncharacterized protein (TIGR03435 family)